MKTAVKTLLLSLLCALNVASVVHAAPTPQQLKLLATLKTMSLSSWIARCKPLEPTMPAAAHCTAQNLTDALQTYSARNLEQFSSAAQNLWVGKQSINYKKFEPFTQKAVLPANSSVYTWGDLHGDVQALVLALEKLRYDGIIDDTFHIIEPDTYFLFLGDYTDRGQHGAEVLYTLLRLKIANPDSVLLVRGNHEDLELNSRFGFDEELQRKFPQQANSLRKSISTFYNTLPVALFLGTTDTMGMCHYLQCCHGGLELGYHPQQLFATKSAIAYEKIIDLPRLNHFKNLTPHMQFSQMQLFQADTVPQLYVRNVTKSMLEPFEVGFMWSDFSALGDTSVSSYVSGRGLSYGQNLTETVLRYYNANSMHKVRGLVRAHQHNPTMPGLFQNSSNKGLYKLPWHAHIFTTVATKQYTPGCGSFLKITTADSFSDWTMTRIHCTKAGSWETLTDTVENY